MGTTRTRLAGAAGVLAVMAAVVAGAIALNNPDFRGGLEGYQEVPAISTDARGRFEAKFPRERNVIRYELSYRGLESDATQAHVHFGQRGVNGGISALLCSNLGTPPTPAGFDQECGLRSDTITGTIRPDDVVGPESQGIAPGELGELRRAIRAGVAYANVHSMQFPGGEIRAQIRPAG